MHALFLHPNSTGLLAISLNGRSMCKLINDFIYGCGVYEADDTAARHAARLTGHQVKRFVCEGVIPVHFYVYLQEIRVLSPNLRVPERARTVPKLSDLLWSAMRSGKGNCKEAEALRGMLLSERLPRKDLNYHRGSAQHIYEKMERDSIYRVKKSRRPQTGQSHTKTLIIMEGARKKTAH